MWLQKNTCVQVGELDTGSYYEQEVGLIVLCFSLGYVRVCEPRWVGLEDR
ncbi:hypothetical protein [Rubritalea tangerina]